MKPSEVIREARNVLFERGWHKGSFEGGDGSVCLEGAFCHALGIQYDGCSSDTAWRAADDAVRAALSEQFGTHTASCSFNDNVAESLDDVLEVLDRAEKLALIAEALDA